MKKLLQISVVWIVLLLFAATGLFTRTLNAAPGINPIPKPTVECTDVKDNEFHSLRPYQASVCNTDYQTALYCGNSVFLTDTFTVAEDGTATPSDPGTALNSRTCVEHPELGVQICDFNLQRDKTFSIDLRDLELPIAGNTEDVTNSVNTKKPYDQREKITDPQKVNEYVSWYLNGIIPRAEYAPQSDTEDKDPGSGISGHQYTVDYSGPLNKLLPLRIQQRERIAQVDNAVNSIKNPPTATGIDQRHNQIVGCTFSLPNVVFLALGIGPRTLHLPLACNRFALEDSKRRLANWDNQFFGIKENKPPLEEEYQNKTFIEYWQDYKEWRGNTCAPVTIPGTSLTILFCINNSLVNNPLVADDYIAELFPYIPYSSTEDTLGKVRVEQSPPSIGQPDPIVITKESVSEASANIYVPHMAEDYQLADTLQQTFVSKDLDLNAPADATTTVGDEFCNVVQVKNNPGDNLFGEQLTPRLSYASQFSCQFVLDSKPRTSTCNDNSKVHCDTTCVPDPTDPTLPCTPQTSCHSEAKCYPTGFSGCGQSWGEQGCGANYVCAEGCHPPEVRECAFTTNHSIPVYTETPYLDDIWAKLVAGPSSVFKHIFPKIGIGSPLLDIVDAPSSASTTYTTTNEGTTVKAANVRSGVSAELYFPHLGGIHEYFLECIQTALRPQGLGRACGDFTSPEDITVSGNVILQYLVAHNSTYPLIRTYTPDSSIHLSTDTELKATYWTKSELGPSFGNPAFTMGDVSDERYSAPGISVGNDGTVYTAWADSNQIFFRKKTSAGWQGTQVAYPSPEKVFHARIAVSSNGTLFIIWHASKLFYIMSTDGGTRWSNPQALGVDYGAVQPASITAGGNNNVAIAWFEPSSTFIIKVGIWNGSSFDINELASGKDVAEPNVAITPNGEYYVTWRSGTGPGPSVAHRLTNGTWEPTIKITSSGTQVQYSIGITSDTEGGIHLFWGQGKDGVFYAYKSPNGPWQGTIQVASTGNNLMMADVTTSSNGRYVHGVVEEFMPNDPKSWVHYFLFSGGGSGTGGGPIGGGPGTPPPPGKCTLTDSNIMQMITGDWKLPTPDAGWQTAFNTINSRGSAAYWSARSMLDGERHASTAGSFPIIQYLTTAWVWFESGSGYPNVYAVNCDDRGAIASQVSAYCGLNQGQVIGPRAQDFQFQIAGYQAMESNKNYQTAFTRLYSPSQLVEKLNNVVVNSKNAGSRNGWSYLGGNGSGLLRFLDQIQTATINDLASRGPDMVPYVHSDAIDREQFFSLLIGKDPAMVAAFNSIAVSNSDLVAKLRNSGCTAYYCSQANRQRLANYVYALWKLDCTP